VNQLKELYRKVGFLALMGSIAFVAGAMLQHFSTSLPGSYTWLEPFRTLALVYEKEWLPTTVFVTILIAELRRRGDRLLLADGKAADEWKPIAFGLGLALFDAVAFPNHNAADIASLLLLGMVAAHNPLRTETWRKVAGHFVLGALAFGAVSYSFSVFKALTLVDRTQVDAKLIAIEGAITGGNIYRAVAAYASTHPALVRLSDWAYFCLFQHMLLVTMLLTGLRQRTERFEYLCALALCYVLGGPLYHLLPGVGPAYYDAPAYAFMNDDPSLYSNYIRGWLFHNTEQILTGQAEEIKTWGYVACMPSLHIAHELVMLFYVRRSQLALALGSLFTAISLVAVVVLGWHYPIDAAGGLVVAAIAITIARTQRDRLMPTTLTPEPDEPLPRRPLKEWIAHLRSNVATPPAMDEARAKKVILVLAGLGLVARLATGLRDLDLTDKLFVPDDAYYMLSAARSLAHGAIPAAPFRPLAACMTAPAFWFSSSLAVPLGWVLLLSCVADAVSVWLLGDIARKLGGPVAGALAAAIWAASPIALANALDGLETAIAFTIELGFIAIWLRKPDYRAGIIGGLALLARVDSTFVVLALCGLSIWKERRFAPLVAFAVALPWWVVSWSRYGALIPQYGANFHRELTTLKTFGWMGGSLFGGPLVDLPGVREFLVNAPILGVSALGLVVVLVVLVALKLKEPLVVALGFSAVGIVIFFAVFAPALWYFRRHLEPVYGIFALLLALGGAKARLEQGWRRNVVLFGLIAGGGLGLSGAGHFVRGMPDRAGGLNGAHGYGVAAREVLAIVPDHATLGAFQSGALTYYAPSTVTVVNLDGAVDPAAKKAIAARRLLDYAYERDLTHLADWRFYVEGLRYVSAKSPRGIDARPIGAASPQGTERFVVYAIDWP
jgi:hypothetical protein